MPGFLHGAAATSARRLVRKDSLRICQSSAVRLRVAGYTFPLSRLDRSYQRSAETIPHPFPAGRRGEYLHEDLQLQVGQAASAWGCGRGRYSRAHVRPFPAPALRFGRRRCTHAVLRRCNAETFSRFSLVIRAPINLWLAGYVPTSRESAEDCEFSALHRLRWQGSPIYCWSGAERVSRPGTVFRLSARSLIGRSVNASEPRVKPSPDPWLTLKPVTWSGCTAQI